MATGDLIGQPLGSDRDFNWVVAVELVLSGVL
jgi:hypothetical protein